MRLRPLIIFFLSCMFISSCKDKGPDYQLEPSMSLPKGSIVIIKGNKLDTLTLKRSNATYSLDSIITTRDTIKFMPVLHSYDHNLKEFSISASDMDSVEFIWPKSMEHISSSSDFAKGRFIIEGDINTLDFNFLYISLKEDNALKLTFEIISDAKDEYNHYNSVIKTPSEHPLIYTKFQAVADSVIKSMKTLGTEVIGKRGLIPQQIEYVKNGEPNNHQIRMELNHGRSTDKKMIYDFIETIPDATITGKGYFEIHVVDSGYQLQQWYYTGEGDVNYDDQASWESQGYSILTNRTKNQVRYKLYNNTNELEYEGKLVSSGSYSFKDIVEIESEEEEEEKKTIETLYTNVKMKIINYLPDEE